MPTPYARYATTLVASAARTVTASSAALVMPDDIVGGSFILSCTAVNAATTPTLNVAIRFTPDDGTTYFTFFRHAQLTGIAADVLNVSFTPFLQAGSTLTPALTGGALNVNAAISRKFTVYWTIGGTSPSFTFAEYFIGYRLATVGTGI
jgi:hypothetical protein